jgi:CheY-like chemotaxis protein
VDDSIQILEGLELLLSEAGHQIMVSTDGNNAIQLLRRQAVDLIITDISMPELNGLELIRSTQQLCPPLPVIAMSGMTEMIDMLLLAEHLGACCTLQKPFSTAQLLQAVKFALCLFPGDSWHSDSTTAFAADIQQSAAWPDYDDTRKYSIN